MKPYVRSRNRITKAEAEDAYWEMDDGSYRFRYHHADIDAIIGFLKLMKRLHPKIHTDEYWLLGLGMRMMKKAKLYA